MWAVILGSVASILWMVLILMRVLRTLNTGKNNNNNNNKSNGQQKLSLGDRMKSYERAMETELDAGLPVLARLDGHGFSKFTAGMSQPFDRRFTLAMALTTEDLMRQSRARTAYCQSDEITLVFFPTRTKEGTWQNYDFNGRVQKLATLLSSFASVRFGHHLREILRDPEYAVDVEVYFQGKGHRIRNPDSEKPLAPKMIASIEKAHFDARIFQVPTVEEAVNCLFWRNAIDCVRNTVSKVGSFHFGHKAMHKTNTGSKLKMLSELSGGDPMTLLHPAITYGCFFKTIKTEEETTEHVKYSRNRVFRFSTLMTALKETMPVWRVLFQEKTLPVDVDPRWRAVIDRPITLYSNRLVETPKKKDRVIDRNHNHHDDGDDGGDDDNDDDDTN